MNPVRVPPAGTGPLRRATTTMRGVSASATGTGTTATARTTTRLCGWFVKELRTCARLARGETTLLEARLRLSRSRDDALKEMPAGGHRGVGVRQWLKPA